MTPETNSHEEIKQLLVENQRLLSENNKILRRMRNTSLITGIFRVIWFLFLIGGFSFIYFQYIEPNLNLIKENARFLEEFTADSAPLKHWYDSMRNGEVNP